MKLKSTLSKVVAQQLGALQGRLYSYGNTRLNQILDELKDSCPPQRRLNSILLIVNNVQSVLTKYKRQVIKYNKLVSRLDTVINSVNAAVSVLRYLPIPTAVAGVGVPIGLTSRYSESLINLTDYLENLKNDKTAVVEILRSASFDVSGVESLLNEVYRSLEKCLNTVDNPEIVSKISQDISESNSRIANQNNTRYTLDNGATYIIEIKQVSESLGVPRRFAQAKNLEGVIVMKGEPSYSSNENILIEELIFRLENQLS